MCFKVLNRERETRSLKGSWTAFFKCYVS